MRKTESDHVHCVLDPGCASRRLFEAVSGKWSSLVVMGLPSGIRLVEALRSSG